MKLRFLQEHILKVRFQSQRYYVCISMYTDLYVPISLLNAVLVDCNRLGTDIEGLRSSLEVNASQVGLPSMKIF